AVLSAPCASPIASQHITPTVRQPMAFTRMIRNKNPVLDYLLLHPGYQPQQLAITSLLDTTELSIRITHKIMPVRIVRLGSPRAKDAGLRIGTVRRPPRGVPKSKFASQNWYDVWFPNLAPSLPSMKLALGAETPAQWNKFIKKYRAEMATPENSHAI